MQVTIDGVTEAFDHIPKQQQQRAIAKARKLLEEEAHQGVANQEEWQQNWHSALQKIKGMWKDRNPEEFESIRKEFTRNFDGER